MIGIGGVGMSGLAVLLSRRGFEVDGCDLAESPRTRWLEGEGVRFCEGHDPAHLSNADIVIATPAVPSDAPERAAAAGRLSMRGEVLARIVSESPDTIAVCGSHGKTTTAMYIARLLKALGEKVEWAIGGEREGFPPAGGETGGVLVVEADESDATLALYRAGILVVTNVDYDHPDTFKTREEYCACFNAARAAAKTFVEGTGLSNEEIAVRTAVLRGHSRVDAERELAKIAAELPDRRFQKIAEGVYADYAHHPAEIRYALARARRQGERTIVLFQPHRFSRTLRFLDDFARSFGDADEVVLIPVYSAFEEPVEGGTSADLYARMREAGMANVRLARSRLEAWEHASRTRKPGDIVVLLGAGDIIDLCETVRAGKPAEKRVIIIGAGSNTWKSDLDLNVEYVRSSGRAAEPGASLGIPWMAGIPGTIGGWVKMNAGAFGHSIGELVEAVKVDGKWIDAADCGFGYRCSSIDGEIEDVRFRELPRGDAAEYLARRPKFPPDTKGSVFKNPPEDFAGRLLEEAGCKGLRVGGAYVWGGHANVIVSGEGATPSDFLALACIMRDKVFFRFGVKLEPEVKGLDIP